MNATDLADTDRHDILRAHRSPTRRISVRRALKYGRYHQGTARAVAAELKHEVAREIDALSTLPSGERQARLKSDLRRCVEGDATYVRDIHAAAKLRADAQRARTPAGAHGVRAQARRSGRRERRSPSKRLATGSSAGADPAPAPPPERAWPGTRPSVDERDAQSGSTS